MSTITPPDRSAVPPSEAGPWRSRGYLPHFDAPGLVQMVTFRLHDALPTKVVAALHAEVATVDVATLFWRRERHLDQGHGACWLQRPDIARVVEQTLLQFDGERYRMLAWTIMPNHVHTVTETRAGWPLADVVHSWKSYTAKRANRLLGRTGRFWYPEYFDRYVRNAQHLDNALRYVHRNAVQAGLVQRPRQWPFCSARLLPPG